MFKDGKNSRNRLQHQADKWLPFDASLDGFGVRKAAAHCHDNIVSLPWNNRT